MDKNIPSDQFLAETRYCDVNNPLIKKAATEITKHSSTSENKMADLFNYVRDNILFRFGYWGKKASQILREQAGMCTNSANLLIALARASNIPAGYGIARVNSREFFRGIILPSLLRDVSDRSVHIYPYIYLNHQWIQCDPSIDTPLAQQAQHLSPIMKALDWDPQNPQLIETAPGSVLKNEGPLANIDSRLDKKAKHARGIPLKVANLYLLFLREKGRQIKNYSELEPQFLKWLKKKNPLYFFLLTAHNRIKHVPKSK